MTPLTDAEVEKLAAGLSVRGKEAFAFLSADEARSPYKLAGMGLKGGFTTLEALHRRKLVEEVGEHLGRLSMPHTTYEYRLTPLGLRVKAILAAGEGA